MTSYLKVALIYKSTSVTYVLCFIFWHVFHGCLCNQALTDVRSNGVSVCSVHCIPCEIALDFVNCNWILSTFIAVILKFQIKRKPWGVVYTVEIQTYKVNVAVITISYHWAYYHSIVHINFRRIICRDDDGDDNYDGGGVHKSDNG